MRKILYIPGLLPKPEHALHREQLFRCLRHAMAVEAPSVLDELDANPDVFDIVSWTHAFYGEHRDLALDIAAIDACLSQTEASAADRREVHGLRVRLQRLVRVGSDYVPWLVPWLAGEKVARHIGDLKRYTDDVDGAGGDARVQLRDCLLESHARDERILLIAHSMGSVIAFDTLWSLCFDSRSEFRLDTLFTMGSPLGQWFVRRYLLGHRQQALPREPANIDYWHNLSAWGDMTCARMQLAPMFPNMRAQLKAQTDEVTHNWFRLDGELNPHAEYGYLANRATARVVADWWRRGG